MSKLALGLLLALSSAALAQEQPQPPPTAPAQPPPPQPTTPQPPAERPVTVSIHVSGEIGFESDFTDSSGSVSIQRAGAGVGVGIPVGQYAQLNLGFDYEHSRYDFENPTGFPTGGASPFDNIDRETLSARFAQHLSREWSYFFGAGLTMTGEEGASTGDSLEGLFYAAPKYAFSENFSVGLGVAVATRLEDNVLVLPLVVLDWDITDQWNLSNNGKLGLVLTYKPNPTWAFSFGGSYDYRDFRLDDQGPIPDGVGRDSRIPVELSAAFTPNKQISIEAAFGVSFAQNIEVLNANGDSVADQDMDAAPYFSLRLGWRF